MAESYSVKAILSAEDKNFTSTFGKAESMLGRVASSIKSGIGFGALMKIGSSAVSAIGSSISGVVSGLSGSSATWKTFSNNMETFGQGNQIESVKKELQDFAQATIYSSSDMASTFAQLAAVGTKNTTALVKGFGGLASASENPAQAMKTLSQQATQAAAKPMIQWQDFKLMLEQTPAGMAAVAKQMGMSTQELVSAVQDGKIATEDFFDTIAKVGTSDAFLENATQYKTMGQAIDGLTETVTNKLQPAFDKLSQYGIDAISKLTDMLDRINFDGITSSITAIGDAFESGGIGGAIGKIKSEFGSLMPVATGIGSVLAGAFATQNFTDIVSNVDSVANAFNGIKRKAIKLIPKKSFDQITTGALNASKNVGNVGTKIGNVVGKLNSGLGGKIGALGGKISNTMTKATADVISFAAHNEKAIGVAKTFASGIGSAFSRMGTAMSTAMSAIAPAALVGVVLAGLGAVYSAFGGQIDQMVALASEKGPQIIAGLGNGISAAIPNLVQNGAQMVTGLMSAITANIHQLMATGTQIIATLASSVSAAAPQMITSAAAAIGALVEGIGANAPQLIASGMQLLASLTSGVSSALPMLAESAMTAVASFAAGILSNLPSILESGAQIIANLAEGIGGAIGKIAEKLPEIVTTIKDGILNTNWIEVGGKIIKAIGSGLLKGAGHIIDGVKSWFGGKKTASAAKTSGQNTAKSYTSGVTTGTSGASSAVTGMVQNIVLPMNNSAQSAATAGTSAGTGFTTGLTGAMSGAVTGVQTSTNAISTALQSVGNTATDFTAVSTGMQELSTQATAATGSAFALRAALASIPTTANGIAGAMTAASASIVQLGSIGSASVAAFVSALQGGAMASVAMGTMIGTTVPNVIKNGMTKLAAIATSAMSGFNASLSSGGSRAVSISRSITVGITAALRSGVGGAYSAGAMIGAGLARGLASMVGAVRAQAAALASAANAAIAAKAKIGSPSKITTQYGEWYGQGWINGIKDRVNDAANMSRALVSFPQPRIPALAGANGISSGDVQMSGTGGAGGVYYFEIPVMVDGREVARATATYTQDEIEKIERRKNRRAGKV